MLTEANSMIKTRTPMNKETKTIDIPGTMYDLLFFLIPKMTPPNERERGTIQKIANIPKPLRKFLFIDIIYPALSQ